MKNNLLIILVAILVSCSENNKAPNKISPEPALKIIDKQAELDKIEIMRAAFEKTVKEQRYGDLGRFVTEDLISIGPGSDDWIAYRALREQHGNKFRYDSIIMTPKETVII